jgi:DNA-binding XRE family transcriptional regulator
MKLICELRNIRLQEHLIDSKREFAESLEVEEHTYSNWEKGKSFPSLERAFEIAEKLKKRIDEVWHP